MQQRVNAFGVSEAELFQAGDDQIEVNLPGVDGRRGGRRSRSARPPSCSSTTGKRTSSTRSARPTRTRTRTTASRSSGCATAVEQASKCTNVGIGKGSGPAGRRLARRRVRRPGPKPRFYVFDKTDKKPLNDGQTYEHARGGAGLARPRRSARTPRSSRSRPACSSCAPSASTNEDGDAASRTAGGSSRIARACRGTDIKNPEQSFDRASATSRSSPSTSRTRAARRSRRSRAGSPSAAPTTRSAATRSRPRSTSRSRSTTSWSPRRTSTGSENPDGIDGATGAQISGNFTIKSAQDLAKILKIGALPLKLDRGLALAGLRDARRSRRSTRA